MSVHGCACSSGPVKTTTGIPCGDGEKHRLFTPNGIEEFEVETVQLSSHSTYQLEGVNSPSILLVLDGEGTAKASTRATTAFNDNSQISSLGKGKVFFVPACTALELSSSPSSKLHIALAHINLSAGDSITAA